MKWRFLALLVVLLGVGCRRLPPQIITPQPTATVLETPTPTATSTPEVLIYVVEEGDTLWDIALQFGVTVEELIAANNLPDPDSLAVGQELIIPLPSQP
ncbi:MAG: LysM peptidoglycan-binding domain-containing protein [Chloroflexi bacterium]|nr:LysM peptidoglycan-binding domain-containing protein [Chloroflexota bacterium]